MDYRQMATDRSISTSCIPVLPWFIQSSRCICVYVMFTRFARIELPINYLLPMLPWTKQRCRGRGVYRLQSWQHVQRRGRLVHVLQSRDGCQQSANGGMRSMWRWNILGIRGEHVLAVPAWDHFRGSRGVSLFSMFPGHVCERIRAVFVRIVPSRHLQPGRQRAISNGVELHQPVRIPLGV